MQIVTSNKSKSSSFFGEEPAMITHWHGRLYFCSIATGSWVLVRRKVEKALCPFLLTHFKELRDIAFEIVQDPTYKGGNRRTWLADVTCMAIARMLHSNDVRYTITSSSVQDSLGHVVQLQSSSLHHSWLGDN